MPRLRLHRSSVIVGLLTAAALVLIEVPGRVGHGLWAGRYVGDRYFEHGWPWAYLRRETTGNPVYGALPVPGPAKVRVRTDLPRWGVPWLNAHNWRLWEAAAERRPRPWEFNGWLLLTDMVATLLVVVLATGAWEFRRRRRPRLVSFSLADVFIATTLVCAALGWLVYLQREHSREMPVVFELAVERQVSENWINNNRVCLAPHWLQSLVGPAVFPDFMWRPSTVNFDYDEEGHEEKFAAKVAQLKHVREIDLRKLYTPVRFSAFRSLPRLQTLEIALTVELCDEDFNELSQLTQMRRLVLDDAGRNDRKEILLLIDSLRRYLPQCEIVDSRDYW